MGAAHSPVNSSDGLQGGCGKPAGHEDYAEIAEEIEQIEHEFIYIYSGASGYQRNPAPACPLKLAGCKPVPSCYLDGASRP